jgi:hypothetical protein
VQRVWSAPSSRYILTTCNSYTHYFHDKDIEKVRDAFKVLKQTGTRGDPISYNFDCNTRRICVDDYLALTDAAPESLATISEPAGPRVVNICPEFFRHRKTKRHLPTNKEEKDEYCKDHKKKKFAKFETGGRLKCRKTRKDAN